MPGNNQTNKNTPVNIPISLAILRLYVYLHIAIIIVSVAKSTITGNAVHLLDDMDWLIFIIAFSSLVISEVILGKA